MTMRSWVLLATLASLATPLSAAINEVRVVAVQPDAEYRSNEKEEFKPIAKDTILKQGDEISVDPDGQVTLAFADSSTVLVRNTTQLKIGSFFTEGGVVRTELLLKMGEIAAKVNKSETTRSDFKIKSPTGTASVRGTELNVVRFDAVRGFEVRLVEGVANVGGLTGTAAVAAGDTGKVNQQNEVKSPNQVKNEQLASTAFPSGTTQEEVKQIQQAVTADTGFQASSSSDVGNVSEVAQTTTIKQQQGFDKMTDFQTSTFTEADNVQFQSAIVTSKFGEREIPTPPFLVISTGGENGDSGFARGSIDVPAAATLEITFDHKFVTTETPDQFFAADDFFLATLTTGGQTLQLARDSVLSSQLFPIDPATLGRGPMDFPGGIAPDTAYETQPRRTVATLPVQAGPASLTFGVYDAHDPIIESAAVIDNIRVRTLPDGTTATTGIVSTTIGSGGTAGVTSVQGLKAVGAQDLGRIFHAQ